MEAQPEYRAELLKRLGLHIRTLRKARGISQEALALEAGFSRSYFSEIELGRRNLSFLNMVKLARGLNVPVRTLVDFEGGEPD